MTSPPTAPDRTGQTGPADQPRPRSLLLVEGAGPDQLAAQAMAAGTPPGMEDDEVTRALRAASAELDRARREGTPADVAIARAARDAALSRYRSEGGRARARAARKAAAAPPVATPAPAPARAKAKADAKAETPAPAPSPTAIPAPATPALASPALASPAPVRPPSAGAVPATSVASPRPRPKADPMPARAPRGPAITAPAIPVFRPPVRQARVQTRHWAMMASFVLFVLAPALMAASYLWTRAADQYASHSAFSVHQEQSGAASSLISGLSSISGTTSPDTDILYQYLYSQDLVAAIDAKVDLRRLWSKPERDPVFAYHGPGTIEDLTDYWARMVTVYYNQGARLIEVRVLAFEPRDAQIIAEAILEQSTVMINRLNEVATADAVRFAELDLAEQRQELVASRQALTAFRNLHQLVDPTSQAASQSGILAGLEQELVASFIELDTLRQNAVVNDPRVAVVERRIKVIEDRIEAERQKVGAGSDISGGGDAFVALVADYERLAADVVFAETAYSAARSALDAAITDARRQSRYLAAHVRPTEAEASRYPERLLLLAVVSVFLFMLWSIAALLFYSLRDRR